jgi:Zn-dependent metalloprotease
MKKLSFTMYLLLACNTTMMFAQRNGTSDFSRQASRLIMKTHSQIPEYMKFKPEHQKTLTEIIPWLKATFGLDNRYGFKELTVESDQIGYTHYRYQQVFMGFPVQNTMYLFHVKEGKVVSMNGLLYHQLNLQNTAVLNEQTALGKALAHIKGEQYMWQEPGANELLKAQTGDEAASYYPKGELMVATQNLNTETNNFRLAYRFDVYSTKPLKREYVFIDAATGSVLGSLNRIHTADTPTTALTMFADTQRIKCDYVSANSNFRLRETKRGNGVETFNLGTGTNYASATDFISADTFWNVSNGNLDQYAPDAHFGAEKTYDFYKKNYNRNSINNSGLKLISYIHYSSNYVNAFWNGSYMTYGDGDGSGVKPLVSLDIAGHEITHGLTSYTANLTYSYESGALNESYSDIFGTAIEWEGDSNNFEWDLATKIGLTIRSMGNPKSQGDPDTYKGTYWYTGAGDNGGVHTNSGVQNYWFYTLSVGDTGTNDNGNFYQVDSIGIKKAAAIAYRTLTNYLGNSSQYADARTYSLIAAEDLYGACSKEYVAVAAAWYAVGIGAPVGQVLVTQNTKPLKRFTQNNDILHIAFSPACGNGQQDTLTSFTFTNTGTSNKSGIKNVKVWYTDTNSVFSAKTLVDSINAPSDTFVINGSVPLKLGKYNHFWLTYDLDSSATYGDLFDAEILSYHIDSAQYPTITSPSGNRGINYCIPNMTYGCYNGQMCISKVLLSNIANTTNNNCNSSAYNDFSSQIAEMERGKSYTATIGVSDYAAYINVWIDYNDDGTFNSSNEQLVTNLYITGNTSTTASISISSTAALGKHRMRIRHQYWNNYASLEACADGYYGEIEDYTAEISNQSDMVFQSYKAIQNTADLTKNTTNNDIISINIKTKGSLNPLQLKNIYFNSANTTDTAGRYNAKLWYTGSSANFATTTTVGITITNPAMLFSFMDTFTLAPGNNYFWLSYDIRSKAKTNGRFDAACDSIILDSTTYTSTDGDPSGYRVIPACQVSTSTYACSYMYISKVEIDSISNSTGCAANSYTKYTTPHTSIKQGDSLYFKVNVTNYDQYISIWLDADDNGSFDSNERVIANYYTSSYTTNGYIYIPSSIDTGKHGIRVRADYYQVNSACAQLTYGETEDYFIKVLLGDTMVYAASGVIQPNTTQVLPASLNNEVIRVIVKTTGTSIPLATTKMKFTVKGSTDVSDISKVKVFYTGQSNVFATTTQFGSTITSVDTNDLEFQDSMALTARNGTNYFWLTYDLANNAKIANYIDGTCKEIRVSGVNHIPDTSAPVGRRRISACIPATSTYACQYAYTKKVKLDTTNNATGCSATSYSDYTNISISKAQLDSCAYTVTTNYSMTFYEQYMTIAIDANDDGVFSLSEQVVTNKYTSNGIISGYFKIPPTFAVGSHIIRIRGDLSPFVDSTGCKTLTYGETEDYTINITQGPKMVYQSAIIKQNTAKVLKSSIQNDILRLKIKTTGISSPLRMKAMVWQTTGTTDTNDIRNARVWFTGNDSIYRNAIQFGSAISNPGIALTFYDSLTLLNDNNYFWLTYDVDSAATLGNFIDATCQSFGFDSGIYLPDTIAPYGRRKIDYCTPTGGQNNSTSYGFGIRKIELNTISNSTTTPSTSAAYYADYSNLKTQLSTGVTYTLKITPGSSASTYGQASIAWVDWNLDGKFDSTEEVSHNYNHSGVLSMSLAVPSAVKYGNFRLRIISAYAYYYNNGNSKFNPCTGQTPYFTDYGECEDYTIKVAPPLPDSTITPGTKAAICLGNTKTFTVASDTGYTYKWYVDTSLVSSGKGGAYNAITFNPSSIGIYIIKAIITDYYGQQSIGKDTVTVTAPTAAGTASATLTQLCQLQADTLFLTGSAGNIDWQYQSGSNWVSSGLTNDTSIIYPTKNITYRAYLTSGACAPDSSNTITITVDTLPKGGTITATKSNICFGNSTKLKTTGYYGSIHWEYDDGSGWQSTGITDDTITVSPTLTTTYRIVATTALCGTNANIVKSITVYPTSIAGTASLVNTTICKGSSDTLLLSGNVGAITWEYNNTNSWQSLGNTNDTVKLTPSVSTSYRAIVTSGTCPSDTSNIANSIVNISPKGGTANINKSTICINDSAKITLTGSIGRVKWLYNNGNGWQLDSDTLTNIYKSPTIYTSYKALLYTSSCGSDSSTTVNLTVNDSAKAGSASISNANLCFGDSAMLILTGRKGSNKWQFNIGTGWSNFINTKDSITVYPQVNTAYRALVSSGVCPKDSTQQMNAVVNVKPKAGALSISKNIICAGDSVYLNLSNSIGTIDWYEDLGNGWNLLNGNGKNRYVTPQTNAKYRAVLTSGACKADTTASANIVVNPRPLGGNVSTANDTICSGTATTLTLTGNNYTLDWEYKAGKVWASLNNASNNISVSPAQTTAYRAKISSTYCGTALSDTMTIVVNPSPNAGITTSTDSIICDGNSISITAKNYLGSLEWQEEKNSVWTSLVFINNPIVLTPHANTNYRAAITNGNCGTVYSNVQKIIVNPLPNHDIQAKTDTIFCEGNSVILYTSAGNGNIYTWARNNQTLTGRTADTLLAWQTGKYRVTQTNTFGCADTSIAMFVLANPVPAQPSITLSTTTKNLMVSSAASGNQWYLFGNAINGANAQTYLASAEGLYTVDVTDQNGCVSLSSVDYNFKLNGVAKMVGSNFNFSVYPNPSNGQYQLKIMGPQEKMLSLNVYDMMGKTIYHERIAIQAGDNQLPIDLSHVANGVYLLNIQIAGSDERVSFKLIKE